MTTRYSPSTGSFYPFDIDYANYPSDLIEVSQADFESAMARPAGHDFDFVNGALVIVPTPVPVESFDAMVARLSDSIDGVVKAIYARYNAFLVAYTPREAAARAFKADGYVGDPGEWVTGFAQPAKLSNQQAADKIIAQADSAHVALPLIDSQRMRKYALAASGGAANAQSMHDDIISKIGTLAAGLA